MKLALKNPLRITNYNSDLELRLRALNSDLELRLNLSANKIRRGWAGEGMDESSNNASVKGHIVDRFLLGTLRPAGPGCPAWPRSGLCTAGCHRSLSGSRESVPSCTPPALA